MVEEVKSYEEFQELINGDEPVIFDFYADWCGPCKTISSIFQKLSEEFTIVKFRKVNVDQQERVSEELQIRSIPTFMVFQKGNKVEEVFGANPVALKAAVSKAAA
ncbi:putative TRX2-thioredoxin II [Pisolithus albus]|nr:putative TRX2-thioredoxin II [Pisolithus albus]